MANTAKTARERVVPAYGAVYGAFESEISHGETLSSKFCYRVPFVFLKFVAPSRIMQQETHEASGVLGYNTLTLCQWHS